MCLQIKQIKLRVWTSLVKKPLNDIIHNICIILCSQKFFSLADAMSAIKLCWARKKTTLLTFMKMLTWNLFCIFSLSCSKVLGVLYAIWNTKFLGQASKSTYFNHVYVLLYSVKFNGDIDIVQFIFTRCVVYSLIQWILCVVLFNYKKYQWLPL